MTEGYKLQVKLGNAEFTAEGSEATVKEQFGQFLAALSAAGVSTNGRHEMPRPDPDREDHRGKQNDGPGPDEALMRRVFSIGGDMLSLSVLPKGDHATADALTLLLYGYREMMNTPTVSSGKLIEATRLSGIPVLRVDRHMDVELVMKAGLKRGSRYSLNNRGVAKAKELLASIFD